MKNILFLLNLYFPLLLFGQFSAPKPVSKTGLRSPSKIISSDFDSDGDIDFIAQGEVGGPDGLAYIEHNEDLNIFMYPRELIAWVSDFEVVDFDGDGDMDLIYLAHGDLGWIENTGDLTSFSEPNLLKSDIYEYVFGEEMLTELFLRDYNSDGDLDVLFFENASSTLSWIENVNDFSEIGIFDSVVIPDAAQVIIEDFDNDQLIDLLVRYSDEGGVYYYKNNGDLGNLTDVTAVFANVGTKDIAVYDADSDDDLDIFIAMEFWAIDDLAWVENLDGQANFSTPQYLGLPAMPTFFTIEDSDGDGMKDLIVIDENAQPQFYKNTGDFDDVELQPSGNFPLMTHFLQADLNQDDTKDFIYWNEDYHEVGWLQTTNQAYVYEEQNLIVDFVSVAASMQFADLTQNGRLDIVTGRDVSFTDDNNIRFLRPVHQLENYFESSIIVRDADDIRNTLLIDVDNDDDLDLLAQHPEGGLGLYINFDGLGTFVSPASFMPDLETIFRFLAVDLDNDNQQDFVYLDSNRQAFWRKNNGNGSFGQANSLNSPEQELYNTPQFVDVDEDGDLDIFYVYKNITSDTEIDSLIWKSNDGQGIFTTPQLIHESDLTPVNITFGDLDDDGNIDLAFSMLTPFASSLDSIIWLPNLNGDGNFAAHKPVANDLTYYADIHIFDIDNDGDNDILYGGGGGSLTKEIRWSENINNGNEFLSHHLVDLPFLLYYMEVADFENDGDLDIFYAAGGSYPIAWLENNFLTSDTKDLEEASPTIDVTIFPNPSNGKIWLTQPSKKINQAIIFNTTGKQLSSISNDIQEGNLLIDLSSYPDGIYWLKVNMGKDMIMKKVVVIR